MSRTPGSDRRVQRTVTPPGGWDELAEEGEEDFRIVKPSRASALASQLIEVPQATLTGRKRLLKKDHLRMDVKGDVQGDTLKVTSFKLL